MQHMSTYTMHIGGNAIPGKAVAHRRQRAARDNVVLKDDAVVGVERVSLTAKVEPNKQRA